MLKSLFIVPTNLEVGSLSYRLKNTQEKQLVLRLARNSQQWGFNNRSFLRRGLSYQEIVQFEGEVG
jgi:hypothetical protein